MLKWFGGEPEYNVNAYVTNFHAFVLAPKSLRQAAEAAAEAAAGDAASQIEVEDAVEEEPYLQMHRIEWSGTKNATILDGGMMLRYAANNSGCVFRGATGQVPIPYTDGSIYRATLEGRRRQEVVQRLGGADFQPFQSAHGTDGRHRSQFSMEGGITSSPPPPPPRPCPALTQLALHPHTHAHTPHYAKAPQLPSTALGWLGEAE